MEYTKGEWKAWRFSKFHNWKVSTGDANWFVDCGMEDNAETNARLMAAAPDLYEACKAQHDAIDRLFAELIKRDKTFFPSKSGQPWEAMLQAHKAIAKAEK